MQITRKPKSGSGSFRFCSRIADDEESGDEVEGGEEGFGEFVVAGGHAAKLFELIEEVLDAVAAAVACLVVSWFLAARTHRWNHRLDPIAREAFANAVGIVAFVERGKFQHVVGVEAFVKGLKLPTIMRLARGQVERDRRGGGGDKGRLAKLARVFVERGRADFGGEAPARAAQSLVAAVFFSAHRGRIHEHAARVGEGLGLEIFPEPLPDAARLPPPEAHVDRVPGAEVGWADRATGCQCATNEAPLL